jgi:molybdopterin-guanine dinucleotide biosynthesis adapter protein
MKPVVLSVVGRKGAGRAAVVESLIASLKGVRVGIIKHVAREDFEIDEPGKDTYLYRKQGAETVMLLGAKKRAVFSDLPQEMSWEENLNYFEGFDLVILEGYFHETVPMIEVHKEESGMPLLAGKRNLLAVSSDVQSGSMAPHFLPDEIPQLAAFVLKQLHLEKAGV